MTDRREHTLSVLVENRPGVLSRVAGMFSRRGFNIESIAVGTTEDPRYSRMTIVVLGDDGDVEQVTKQLHKLVDVIKISELDPAEMVERELALIKVSADRSNRSEILQIVDIFRAKIVDVSDRSLVVEVTGDTDKVKAIVDLLRPFGIKEIVRTGRVGMARGPRGVEGSRRAVQGLEAVGAGS
ncbi:MAG: acetolactate synthase small subunit [Firmicutes bacterium]|nr:acetolactate synthase small subunit [Bacillota bacterium]